MKCFEPMIVTDALFVSSNVPETDHAAWAIATPYIAGNRVIVIATHSVYEAVGATTGDDPTTDDGTNWVRVGPTNRWRAFDGNENSLTTNSTTIEYVIEITDGVTDGFEGGFVDGVGFFGLNALSL